MKNPLVLEIKCNSLDDGPGVRTVVFVKGCPLSCVWCHNPESKKIENEISYSADDCIECGCCLKICTKGALSKSNPYYIDRTKCDLCFDCVEACPAKALTRVGNEVSSDEIVSRVMADKIFYDISGGGLTLSGGEITLYPEFAGEVLSECKAGGVNTLIETCGFFDYNRFERLMLPYIDIIYFDIKIYDCETHKKYCGAPNSVILENFARLFCASKTMDFTLLPRTPLIPDITDTDDNLTAIADFLADLGVKKSALLPYNPTWYQKNAKLGLHEQSLPKTCDTWQSADKINHCKDIFRNRNIEV